MPSNAQCQARAKRCIAQAKRTPRHKTRLLHAAQSWRMLARGMKRMEAPYRKLGKLN